MVEPRVSMMRFSATGLGTWGFDCACWGFFSSGRAGAAGAGASFFPFSDTDSFSFFGALFGGSGIA